MKRDKSLCFFIFLGELQRMAYSLSNLRRLTINLEENQTRFIYKSGRSIYTLNLEQYGSHAAHATVSCAVLRRERLSSQ